MSNVAVCVRFRPPNSKEARHGSDVISPASADHESFAFKDDNNGETTFSFDRVFHKDCSQAEVYDVVALPIVKDAMNAINGTILAYGQTGAGKTHTMEGPNMLADSAEMKGILPRVAQSIFELIEAADATSEFIIKLAMVEIYKEKIRDLFDVSKDNLQVKEDKVRGIFVAGVTEVYLHSEDEMVKLLEAGITNRAIGTTRSEKLEKTGVDGALLEEAKMINKSLSALGNVINSLTTDKAIHVPYRDSRLTRILQESLGGNSRTTLLCCCSPSSLNSAETLSTLRFGARAKQIKNKPKINVQPGQNDLERSLEKSRQEYKELQNQFRLLNARLGLSAEGRTMMSELHVLSDGEDVPNCVFDQRSQSLERQTAPTTDAIVCRMKDLLIASGVIASSTNLESPSPNSKLLEDDDEEFNSQYLSNLSLSSSDVELDSRSLNDAMGRTLQILKNAVADLERKCKKLIQENEGLKAEMIAMERVLAHSRKSISSDSFSELQEEKCSQRPSILRPLHWGRNGLYWLGLRGTNAQPKTDCSDFDKSNFEESTNLTYAWGASL